MNYDSNMELFNRTPVPASSDTKSLNSDQEPRFAHIDMTNPINRLAYTNLQRERQNKHAARIARSKISQEWKKKMAGNNTLDDKIGGMQVYHNKADGKHYVHLNDLRTALSQKAIKAGISQYERMARPTITILDSFLRNNTRSGEELANLDTSLGHGLDHSQQQDLHAIKKQAISRPRTG